MSIKKQTDGKWLLDFYPEGKPKGKPSKRIRKTFSTKGEALAYQKHVIENLHNKPWLDGKEDRRTLRQLVYMWFDEHGITLDDGEKRKSSMEYACECMGEPTAHEFDTTMFSLFRKKRLSGEFSRTSRIAQVTPRTVNLELTYFRAVFNELKRLGHWKHENPLETMRPFKTEESEMSFLTKEQIDLLLKECQNSRSECLYDVVRVCLATGARWSESESLRRAHVTPYRITFMNTKGNRNRTVPISQALYESLPQTNGALFTPCYSAFRKAMQRTGIELPDGQLSHVLRHTFASHFMMNGGNILVLQRILGHTDIKMTMRYAHFAPDHLEEAIKLNPLEN
ncbi:phage integrase [Pectobacterium aquaticum]|uniref:phage integrase n=1 Tax=Pectobacterium aquaticum TaxID=2204145 RepID=UPI000E25809F|nr:tyrosine-type recombinase/integrase [Pectobacterium aquaticum]UEM40052.1 tyrosine-type recombinase/integrase [Pectobacterium aquaticum]